MSEIAIRRSSGRDCCTQHQRLSFGSYSWTLSWTIPASRIVRMNRGQHDCSHHSGQLYQVVLRYGFFRRCRGALRCASPGRSPRASRRRFGTSTILHHVVVFCRADNARRNNRGSPRSSAPSTAKANTFSAIPDQDQRQEHQYHHKNPAAGAVREPLGLVFSDFIVSVSPRCR